MPQGRLKVELSIDSGWKEKVDSSDLMREQGNAQCWGECSGGGEKRELSGEPGQVREAFLQEVEIDLERMGRLGWGGELEGILGSPWLPLCWEVDVHSL